METKQKSEWETIYKFQPQGDEDYQATHPFEDYALDSFDKVRMFLDEQESLFKENYDELRIHYCTKFHGYGAQTNWYELQGRYTDPTKIVLYGQIKKDPQP